MADFGRFGLVHCGGGPTHRCRYVRHWLCSSVEAPPLNETLGVDPRPERLAGGGFLRDLVPFVLGLPIHRVQCGEQGSNLTVREEGFESAPVDSLDSSPRPGTESQADNFVSVVGEFSSLACAFDDDFDEPIG